MQTEFKEKTYEKYFGIEIARRTNVTFSPDQVDEAHLGFDDAFRLSRALLGKLLRPSSPRPLPGLRGMNIREIEDLAQDLAKRMPPFRFNLFVQYKRPEYLSRASAQEWDCWNAPYFRYETTPHQQDLLEALETQSRGRAAIVYASPAFWRAEDMWRYAASETVIGNSNVAAVGKLRGHNRFSYATAGSNGQGHSEPIRLESPSFDAVIGRGMMQPDLPFNEHIQRAANEMEESLRGSRSGMEILDQVRFLLFGPEVAGVRVPDDSLAVALQKIEVLSEAMGVSFVALG